MKTARDITSYLGRERIQAALGLSRRNVTQWEQMNLIPALYYDALERMTGRPLPRSIFTFKGLSDGSVDTAI
jgi:hypothetical protein